MTYVMFTDSISLAFGAACVFILLRRQPAQKEPLAPRLLWLIAPLIFIGIMVFVTVNVIRTEPTNAAIGTAVFVAGLFVYYLRIGITKKGQKV